MRTKRVNDAPLSFSPSEPAGVWAKSYEIKLLTPMVGGGVTNWQVDRAQPIRASEIKHHLRFWWRTMQDPATSIEELRKYESRLFGDTEGASSVRLMIEQESAKDAQLLQLQIGGNGRCYDWKGLPGYVLFPLLGQKDAQKMRITNFTLLKEYSFTLRLTCPFTEKTAIENAAILWLLFGGLGARTRRGAGSIWCPEVNNQFASETVLSFLRNVVPARDIKSARPSSAFPVLSGGRLAISPIEQMDATAAWEALLGLGNQGWARNPPGYGDFRQGRNLARGPGAGRPGRSRWPEADALRTMCKTWSPTHKPRPDPGEWYPRAAYGLPVQFRFNRDPAHGGDPAEPDGDFSLLPVDTNRTIMDRWPSPFILKIVQAGGRLLEVGLLLNQQMPDICCNRDLRPGGIQNSAQPGEHSGKKLPYDFPIPAGHPHDGLFAQLFRGVTPYDL